MERCDERGGMSEDDKQEGERERETEREMVGQREECE